MWRPKQRLAEGETVAELLGGLVGFAADDGQHDGIADGAAGEVISRGDGWHVWGCQAAAAEEDGQCRATGWGVEAGFFGGGEGGSAALVIGLFQPGIAGGQGLLLCGRAERLELAQALASPGNGLRFGERLGQELDGVQQVAGRDERVEKLRHAGVGSQECAGLVSELAVLADLLGSRWGSGGGDFHEGHPI